MPITMYDSVNAGALPKGAGAYAGYVDGAYKNFSELPAASYRLDIAVFASDDATCLDVEPGNATNADVYSWFLRQVARGVWRPVIYTSVDNMDAMVATMTANGFPRQSYRLWSAHYAGYEHVCGPSTCGLTKTACDGTQWASNASYDTSILNDGFFGVTPMTAPAIPGKWTQIISKVPVNGGSGDQIITGIGEDGNMWEVYYTASSSKFGQPYLIGTVMWK